MKTDYQHQLERMIADARFPGTWQITYKSVFGAVAAYADGHIFMTCGKFGLALKLTEDKCAALMTEGLGEPLKYFEKGHVKRNYVVLRDEILEDKPRLKNLISESAAFVQDAK